jgi:PHP family Zn ribbon phosphoesterase
MSLRAVYQELQQQLPLHSDLMTDIVGAEAYYSESQRECYSTVTSNIDLEKFIQASAKMNNEITEDQLLQFLSNESGQSRFIGLIKDKFNRKIKRSEFPSNSKGFVYREIYSFTGLNYEKLVLEHRF